MPFVGTVELARLLGVSAATIKRRVRQGRIPLPVKVRPNFDAWPVDAIADPREPLDRLKPQDPSRPLLQYAQGSLQSSWC